MPSPTRLSFLPMKQSSRRDPGGEPAEKSVSVRGGGHGIAGRAIRGNWVIDMRPLDDLRFDGERVTAGAGLTWKQLDEFSAHAESRSRAGRCPRPASPASRWAVESAGCSLRPG